MSPSPKEGGMHMVFGMDPVIVLSLASLAVQYSLYDTPRYSTNLDKTRSCYLLLFFYHEILQRNCKKIKLKLSFLYNYLVKLSLNSTITYTIESSKFKVRGTRDFISKIWKFEL